MADHDAIARYWGRERLIEAILDALAARGVNLDAPTPSRPSTSSTAAASR
jgi:hypothetical protein